MKKANYPITETIDGSGIAVWIVNGECFGTEKEAIERQRQLEEQLQAPPSPTGDDESNDEEPPAAPFFSP